MRFITTILLTFIAIAATQCQPDPDFKGYTERYVDSVFVIKDSLEKQISNKVETVSDTITYIFRGEDENSTIITINKKGNNATVQIISGEKRLQSKLLDGERSSYFYDNTYTVGSLLINKSSTKGFGAVDFEH